MFKRVTAESGRRSIRLSVGTAALVFGVLGGGVLTAPPASASATAAVMATTQRMSGPSLSGSQSGWYGAGSRVTLDCFKRGQAVKGYYSRYIAGGYDNLWYRASDGRFIADVDINTGSNKPVTTECGVVPPPAPAPAPPQAAPPQAPAPVASSGRAWGQTRATNDGVAGNCTFGAYEQFKAYTGVYPALSGHAMSWYNSARTTGWTTSFDAQPNAIVVFRPGVKGAGEVGHVAWVDQTQRRADGLYIHVIEMNGWSGDGGGLGIYNTRWVKDVAGMSYILAPHR